MDRQPGKRNGFPFEDGLRRVSLTGACQIDVRPIFWNLLAMDSEHFRPHSFTAFFTGHMMQDAVCHTKTESRDVLASIPDDIP